MNEEKMAIYANNVDSSIRNYSSLQSLLLGEELNETQVTELKQFKCVKEYFDSPIGDPKEAEMKKLITTAVIAAKDKGTLPFELPATGSEELTADIIAATVDEGLTRAKVAYKVAKGELDPIDATDILIDKSAARLTAAVDKAFETGVANELITNGIITVCTYVGFPQVAAYRPVIKSVVQRV